MSLLCSNWIIGPAGAMVASPRVAKLSSSLSTVSMAFWICGSPLNLSETAGLRHRRQEQKNRGNNQGAAPGQKRA